MHKPNLILRSSNIIDLVGNGYFRLQYYYITLEMISVNYDQVRDLAPIQCYAFTLGHVISINQSLQRQLEPGRHLLYENSLQSLQVVFLTEPIFQYYQTIPI